MALLASHVYHRGIQHVRNARVIIIITIHSVCVCMCLLCEKKRLWDSELWLASLPRPYHINLWKIFCVFCVWLWQPHVMTVVPLWFISITGRCVPCVRHWLKHDRSQTILFGFSHGSQWSKCFDCKTWNVLWIDLLVSELTCVFVDTWLKFASVLYPNLDINYNPVWLTGLKAPTN